MKIKMKKTTMLIIMLCIIIMWLFFFIYSIVLFNKLNKITNKYNNQKEYSDKIEIELNKLYNDPEMRCMVCSYQKGELSNADEKWEQ